MINLFSNTLKLTTIIDVIDNLFALLSSEYGSWSIVRLSAHVYMVDLIIEYFHGRNWNDCLVYLDFLFVCGFSSIDDKVLNRAIRGCFERTNFRGIN